MLLSLNSNSFLLLPIRHETNNVLVLVQVRFDLLCDQVADRVCGRRDEDLGAWPLVNLEDCFDQSHGLSSTRWAEQDVRCWTRTPARNVSDRLRLFGVRPDRLVEEDNISSRRRQGVLNAARKQPLPDRRLTEDADGPVLDRQVERVGIESDGAAGHRLSSRPARDALEDGLHRLVAAKVGGVAVHHVDGDTRPAGEGGAGAKSGRGASG